MGSVSLPASAELPASRRLPVGAEVLPGGGVHFRVWAPDRDRVEVVAEGGPGDGAELVLSPEPGGYFSGTLPRAAEGTRYRYRLDGDAAFPDPASRFQPEGPHGPSQVVDPGAYVWRDRDWRGVTLPGQVIYELHVGTFTPEGTWEAAARRLADLRDLGVTLIELMPVAEFAGRHGWGYDGVAWMAPFHVYGSPDGLRRFVDTAHGLGLGVLLDVVYNHLGPDGCYLLQFARAYKRDGDGTEWGDALDFDGPDSGPVRELVLASVRHWMREYHLDGLRIDATQAFDDASDEHVLAALTRVARESARWPVLVLGENEPQHAALARPVERGGIGLDALWNDDFHHACRVAATGRTEAYFTDYRGRPQELVSAVRRGFLYQGQHYRWQKQRRGTPAGDLPASRFVCFLENHDQVANSACGARLHQLTTPGRHRALTALLLLAPSTPMLFQGQEFASSRPFLYFVDHHPELAEKVRRGRAAFLAQFPSLDALRATDRLPDPTHPDTFHRCKLDWTERRRHAPVVALHRDLLRLRRTDPAFADQRGDRLDGAVLDDEAFVLRFAADGLRGDRLLVVNLGRDLNLSPAPEPLLAPPEGARWAVLWTSEAPEYGGCGLSHAVEAAHGWRIPGHAAVVLRPHGGPDE